MIPWKYLVLDLETTGLPKRGDYSGVYITEAAMVACCAEYSPFGDRGVVDDAWCANVMLPRQAVISPEAERITGITRQDCASGIPAPDMLDIVADWLSGCNSCLVGHNILGFDIPCLASACVGVGNDGLVESMFGRDAMILDTMLLWRAWKLGLRRRPWEPVNMFHGRCMTAQYWGGSSLEHVARELGVMAPDEAQRHRALDDCRLTHRVFEAMRGGGILAEVLGE